MSREAIERMKQEIEVVMRDAMRVMNAKKIHVRIEDRPEGLQFGLDIDYKREEDNPS